MRSPLPVGVPVASQGPWVWVGLLVPSLTAGVIAQALVEHWGGPASLPIGALAVLLGLFLGDRWRVRPAAPWRLNWTGAEWTLRGEGEALRRGSCTVLIDLGDWVLLRWRPDLGAKGRLRWLPISRRDGADRAWREFRLALRWAPAPDDAQRDLGQAIP